MRRTFLQLDWGNRKRALLSYNRHTPPRKEHARLAVGGDRRDLKSGPGIENLSTQRWPQLRASYLEAALSASTTATDIMSAGIPRTFWSSPVRYLKWASHEKPAIFFSVIVGCMGPASFFIIPPIRRIMGDQDPPPIPMTYPSESLHIGLAYASMRRDSSSIGTNTCVHSSRGSEEDTTRIR